ncbi:hypothetical protein CAEBREN_02699 [Caenorhabditis brenneri]|uniref:Uncharacterized protein n=1 Tax=Caenorhabditis brenneri TaxID=135651 RepID=G0NQQ8_CAEBE|nr:hypothetical protein CAEBREN_02699 [Caenorhabditis brenneri]
MKGPEGFLRISHEPTEQEGDTDRDWGFKENEGSVGYIPKGARMVQVYEEQFDVHGWLEMELSYEGHTTAIEKRNERFYEIKKNIYDEAKKRGEEKRLEKSEAEKQRKKIEKKKCCSIL